MNKYMQKYKDRIIEYINNPNSGAYQSNEIWGLHTMLDDYIKNNQIDCNLRISEDSRALYCSSKTKKNHSFISQIIGWSNNPGIYKIDITLQVYMNADIESLTIVELWADYED